MHICVVSIGTETRFRVGPEQLCTARQAREIVAITKIADWKIMIDLKSVICQ
jgi:hypothetical protein